MSGDMNMRPIRLIIAAILLVSPFAANADPIVTTQDCGFSSRLGDGTGETCVSSIQDLEILGVMYDVRFSVTQFNSAYGSSTPTFFGDEAGATAAATSLVDLFNSVGGIHGTTDGSDFLTWALVPLSCAGDGCSTKEANNVDGGWGVTPGNVGTELTQTEPWAIFTVVSVPEPGTLALFGNRSIGIRLSET
jgi:hypothetical protein